MKIDYSFSVAPMMGYTTPYARYFYRLLSKKTLLFTEMITSQALVKGNKSRLCQKNHIENPVILQVGGNDEDELRQCAHIAENFKYNGINLNIGCPSKKVQKGKFGACLMKEADQVSKIIKSIISETNIDVSIKCRTGVDDNESYEFLKNFIGKTTEAGCNIFFIHARKALLKTLNPQQNRTIPKLEYEKVFRLKKDFPENKIILNGGIESIEYYDKICKKVDGVMVGRLIQKNPFALLDVDSKIFKIKKSNINKINIIKNYFRFIKEFIGEKSSYSLISPLMAMYFGMPNSRIWKKEINKFIRNKNFENLEKICIDSFA